MSTTATRVPASFWDEQTSPFHKDSPLYNRNQNSYTLEDVYRWGLTITVPGRVPEAASPQAA